MGKTFQLKKKRIQNAISRFTRRVHNRAGDRLTLNMIAVVIGLLCGAVASLLHFLTNSVAALVGPGGLYSEGRIWPFVIPWAGIIITGILCRYVFRANLEHGSNKLETDIRNRKYRLEAKLTYAPIITSSIAVGCGGSAGVEDPIIYSGGAIGSNAGKLFGLPDGMLRILIGCGASAGISGIFIAPVTGLMFCLEVLCLELSTVTVIAVTCSCLTATLTAFCLNGMHLNLLYSGHLPFQLTQLLPLLLLGLFCGFFSLYYSFMMVRTENVFNLIRNPWAKNIISGAAIALLVYIFPTLYGEGHGVMERLINGSGDSTFVSALPHPDNVWGLFGVLAGILAVKALATQSTNSGGGVGGDFTPTLFSGSIAGFLFASFATEVLGADIPASDFALYGMAGVMAGAIKAPLMAIFLVAETIGDYNMLLPLTICALSSFGVVRAFTRITGVPVRPAWRHIETY